MEALVAVSHHQGPSIRLGRYTNRSPHVELPNFLALTEGKGRGEPLLAIVQVGLIPI